MQGGVSQNNTAAFRSTDAHNTQEDSAENKKDTPKTRKKRFLREYQMKAELDKLRQIAANRKKAAVENNGKKTSSQYDSQPKETSGIVKENERPVVLQKEGKITVAGLKNLYEVGYPDEVNISPRINRIIQNEIDKSMGGTSASDHKITPETKIKVTVITPMTSSGVGIDVKQEKEYTLRELAVGKHLREHSSKSFNFKFPNKNISSLFDRAQAGSAYPYKLTQKIESELDQDEARLKSPESTRARKEIIGRTLQFTLGNILEQENEKSEIYTTIDKFLKGECQAAEMKFKGYKLDGIFTIPIKESNKFLLIKIIPGSGPQYMVMDTNQLDEPENANAAFEFLRPTFPARALLHHYSGNITPFQMKTEWHTGGTFPDYSAEKIRTDPYTFHPISSNNNNPLNSLTENLEETQINTYSDNRDTYIYSKGEHYIQAAAQIGGVLLHGAQLGSLSLTSTVAKVAFGVTATAASVALDTADALQEDDPNQRNSKLMWAAMMTGMSLAGDIYDASSLLKARGRLKNITLENGSSSVSNKSSVTSTSPDNNKGSIKSTSPVRDVTPGAVNDGMKKVSHNLDNTIEGANLLNSAETGSESIRKAILNPAGSCEAILSDVENLMKKNEFTNIKHRGMHIWNNGMEEVPTNHFVVVGTKNGKEYVFDLTAHQFKDTMPDLSGPLILSHEDWTAKYQGATIRKRITYTDYTNQADAKRNYSAMPGEHSVWTLKNNEESLTTPVWYKNNLEGKTKDGLQGKPYTLKTQTALGRTHQVHDYDNKFQVWLPDGKQKTPDKLILSAHGYSTGKTVNVPKGKVFYFYSEHGRVLTDRGLTSAQNKPLVRVSDGKTEVPDSMGGWRAATESETKKLTGATTPGQYKEMSLSHYEHDSPAGALDTWRLKDKSDVASAPDSQTGIITIPASAKQSAELSKIVKPLSGASSAPVEIHVLACRETRWGALRHLLTDRQGTKAPGILPNRYANALPEQSMQTTQTGRQTVGNIHVAPNRFSNTYSERFRQTTPGQDYTGSRPPTDGLGTAAISVAQQNPKATKVVAGVATVGGLGGLSTYGLFNHLADKEADVHKCRVLLEDTAKCAIGLNDVLRPQAPAMQEKLDGIQDYFFGKGERIAQNEIAEIHSFLSDVRNTATEDELLQLYRTGKFPTRFSGSMPGLFQRISLQQFDRFAAFMETRNSDPDRFNKDVNIMLDENLKRYLAGTDTDASKCRVLLDNTIKNTTISSDIFKSADSATNEKLKVIQDYFFGKGNRITRKEEGEIYTFLSTFRGVATDSEWQQLYRTGQFPDRLSNAIPDVLRRIQLKQFDRFTAFMAMMNREPDRFNNDYNIMLTTLSEGGKPI
ncbi:putative adhesin [Serratia bockelmannii]|uniref:putative adhesin n=1 Tax=Serratia bockelmannii TaxID=2703793 RepID=UPI003FA7CAD8